MTGACVVHIKKIAVLPVGLDICCIGSKGGPEFIALVLAVRILTIGDVTNEGDIGV